MGIIYIKFFLRKCLKRNYALVNSVYCTIVFTACNTMKIGQAAVMLLLITAQYISVTVVQKSVYRLSKVIHITFKYRINVLHHRIRKYNSILINVTYHSSFMLTMKLIMQISLPSCYFLPLRTNYFLSTSP